VHEKKKAVHRAEPSWLRMCAFFFLCLTQTQPPTAMDRWLQILIVTMVITFFVTRNLQVSFVVGGFTGAADFAFISRKLGFQEQDEE
jgi:hypothetical protein